jgi:hypothetical protein
MTLQHRNSVRMALILAFALLVTATVSAQQPSVKVLIGAELMRVVPTGFYFAGQSAPTQMRNASAARLGEQRLIIPGMVDTSGYSSEIRAKYEGFLITDSRIEIGGRELNTGAYGFGFSDDGKLNIFDIGGNRVFSVPAQNDKDLRRPRPLMLVNAADGLRLYSGRSFAVISVK